MPLPSTPDAKVVPDVLRIEHQATRLRNRGSFLVRTALLIVLTGVLLLALAAPVAARMLR